MDLKAKWIWSNLDRLKDYNQSAIFIRDFCLPPHTSAVIAITADSWYRLRVNGQWINDGPARNFPAHYQYDEIDLTGVLHEGENRIEVIARYFGSGTAHQLPQQAGFLAQMEVVLADGDTFRMGTDKSWMAADFAPLITNTARFSIKQEASELYDARLVSTNFLPAIELYDALAGPWAGLHPRDCRLLTKNEVHFRRFISAGRITSRIWNLSIPAQKLLHPGLATTNFSTSLACGAAFKIVAEDERSYDFLCENLDVYINGIHLNPVPDLLHRSQGGFRQGENILVVFPKYPFENQTDLCITIINPSGLLITNVCDGEDDRICFLRFPQFHWLDREIPHHMWANRELQVRQREAIEFLAELGGKITSCTVFREVASEYSVQLERSAFSNDEAHWEFCARQIEPLPAAAVDRPENLIYDTPEWAVIPSGSLEDIELIYDLGEQNCGYWDFELSAPAGTVVDLFAVEYINEAGLVQHTDDVRNGFRYICREGLNRHTSFRRRSGRYLFLSLRNRSAAVRIKFVRLIASTYPVDQQGTFRCSDEQINRIWNISARTVKLCMEDVFTDCPCYEQTLWLGDARNIALFSYPVYAPWDLGRRCLRLGGHSLDLYPIVGSQVPSGWDCLIPVWGFLWGVAVWDYYEETADRQFLEEIFPQVLKNIDGACVHLDPDNGLFCMYTWNLFEWVETDTHQPRMLYDSMVLSGTMDAAIRCAEVLQREDEVAQLRQRRRALNAAINQTWMTDGRGYPDSLRKPGERPASDLPLNLAPGTVSEKYEGPCRDISVHTSMLSILFDIVEAENLSVAAENVLHPRPELFGVRGMFARFYLYQCMEKLGAGAEVAECLKRDYLPMLREDATTTWENFLTFREVFPCRSHSHAWSAGALHFLYRLVLGLKMNGPGASEFILSPFVEGLGFAEGYRATVKGPVWVSWKRVDNELTITTKTPTGVRLTFQSNPSLHRLNVVWNGVKQI